ncbi:OmpA family protein [Desulfatibacillum alkenivorans DSM 16219]|jgi:OOP family OmpA-OmpF porin|uniref:OmpA family protein n=1 Tax=Desulfatibacillum alkenivorans DSM 16219 TaxID=1121393 RepID=A0A1M6HED9_9BACT|nr:OmpA family protein [Desulfatibacillum alkenivorans]SHJ20513.1 OmpA family protein [Desulfatibacillum alkenivorans DSM 16219]
MKNSRLIILTLSLGVLLLPACASNKEKQAQTHVAPPPAQTAEKSQDRNGIGEIIDAYEGKVVAKSAHATLVRVDKDLDHDGVTGKADKCPGTPKGAPVDENGCWNIQVIQFDLNSTELNPAGQSVLDAVSSVLHVNKAVKLSIEGHACSAGDNAAYNNYLSLQRAQAVKDYLISKGVDGARMSLTGYGANQPVKDNKTRAHRIQNRRVIINPITR